MLLSLRLVGNTPRTRMYVYILDLFGGENWLLLDLHMLPRLGSALHLSTRPWCTHVHFFPAASICDLMFMEEVRNEIRKTVD